MKCKYIFVTVISTIIALYLAVFASAHGGKTDESGGHYDNSTGEYHYHHGYPAHSHTGGECPYDFQDKTDHSSGSGSGNKTSYYSTTKKATSKEETEKNPVLEAVVNSILWGLFAVPLIYLLYFSGRGIVGSFIENERTSNVIVCTLILLCLVGSVLIFF